MDPNRILVIAILVAATLSFSCLILPDITAKTYVSTMHPFIRFLGFVLASRVASIYEKELKKSSLFLLLSPQYPPNHLLYRFLLFRSLSLLF